MSEENVKVAVRVRPFNQREKDAKSSLIVDMVGNQTLIKKPKANDEPKKFGFDYSYWSHDGFKTESNGYFSAENPKYCDQKKVFNDLGVGVLNNSWEGFNASLFAYGQTGSGKSYSVVGYSANKGIVPMICEEIFNRIGADKGGKIQYEVTFSMLEIYSESVRDLLNVQGDKKQGLPVREDMKNGFYAQGLKKQLVASYVDITKLTDEGNASRTIAATNMNATSSRAHTIIAISLVQKYKNDAGKEMAKSSVINLVDLAGSERADATGATGDRLKEGAAINLSLTSLGNVISALADNSSGKNVRVPYRDSVLTKLLMNALGGNSKTIMIAAISPADINFDESVSTLRYADRAKQIKCKAVVNEDPTEKLIKSLQDENAKLKELLKSGGKIDPAMLSGSSDPNNKKDSEEQLKKLMAENEKQMIEMKKSYEQKLQEAKTQTGELQSCKIKEKAKTLPHFSNINMDPTLSHTVKIVLEGQGKKTLGVPGKSDIPLNGLGIMDPHGYVTIEGGKFFIERCDQSKILQNGKPITNKTELKHMDRLVFGTTQYFLFIEPAKKTPSDPFVTFEMTQDEIAKESGLLGNTKDMSRDEIRCQNELVDLIPAVEEANQISIVLDKKIKFEALIVSAEARGEYDSKIKPYVHVKNFQTGLEWMWDKAKFLDRKTLMSEYYADFKDDGIINRDKFKNFDPFMESPDTPTQIGTAAIFPKSFAYMVANKGDFKIVNFFGNQAGKINVDILPCDKTGRVLTDKDGIVITNPEKDLLNKMVHFTIKINGIRGLDEKYEDIFCQFTMFKDPALNKTETVRGTNNPDFKFSKIFSCLVTQELLDNLMNKSLYIQIWSEQKHPKPDAANSKISTKDYFAKEKEIHGGSAVNGGINKHVDTEKMKLKEDLNVYLIKEKRYMLTMENVQKLITLAQKNNRRIIPPEVLKQIFEATNKEAAEKILSSYLAQPEPNQNQQVQPITVVHSSRPVSETQNTSTTCNIL